MREPAPSCNDPEALEKLRMESNCRRWTTCFLPPSLQARLCLRFLPVRVELRPSTEFKIEVDECSSLRPSLSPPCQNREPSRRAHSGTPSSNLELQPHCIYAAPPSVMSAPGWALSGIPLPLFNVEFATGAEDDARNSLRHTPTLKRGEAGETAHTHCGDRRYTRWLQDVVHFDFKFRPR